MSYVVNLGLDDELPLTVFADVSLIYRHEYVVSRAGRQLKATEDRVQRLVQNAIHDVRRALKLSCSKAEDYLAFRVFVIDTLCREYGFEYACGTINNILRSEVEDLIVNPIPKLSDWWRK